MTKRFFFLDGKTLKATDRELDSFSPGNVIGRGVFETMRVYQGKIFAWDWHMERMRRGLRIYKIRSPLAEKLIKNHCQRVLKRNNFRSARLRVMIWKDKTGTRLSIIAQPVPANLPAKSRRGYKAVISNVRRNRTRTSHIKSIDYKAMKQAHSQARQKGYDEAILLNNRKKIVEGAYTNIFWIKRGVVFTPLMETGCLQGVTRRIILKCATKLRIPVKKVKATPADLFKADEAFLSNSLVTVMPLTRVNNKRIGSAKPGPITLQLKKQYDEVCKQYLQDNRLKF